MTLTTRCFAGPTDLERVEMLGDNVLVQRVEAPTVTKGGIALPTAHADAMNPDRKTINCVVLVVGPGKLDEDGEKRTPMEVQVDDEAIVDLFAVTDVDIDRTPMFVVAEKDIMAVIR